MLPFITNVYLGAAVDNFEYWASYFEHRKKRICSNLKKGNQIQKGKAECIEKIKIERSSCPYKKK